MASTSTPCEDMKMFWGAIQQFAKSKRTTDDQLLRDRLITLEMDKMNVDDGYKSEWVFPVLAALSSMLNCRDPLSRVDALAGMEMNVCEEQMTHLVDQIFQAADFFGVACRDPVKFKDMVKNGEDFYSPVFMNFAVVQIHEWVIEAIKNDLPLLGNDKNQSDIIEKALKMLIDACEKRLRTERGVSAKRVAKFKKDFSMIFDGILDEGDYKEKLAEIQSPRRYFRANLMIHLYPNYTDALLSPQRIATSQLYIVELLALKDISRLEREEAEAARKSS